MSIYCLYVLLRPLDVPHRNALVSIKKMIIYDDYTFRQCYGDHMVEAEVDSIVCSKP